MVAIAVVNQKGGVGKTTTTLGLAGAATAIGLDTLVIDLDPQANASSGLAVWEAEATVAEALDADVEGALGDVLVKAGWPDDRPGRLSVAAATGGLAATEARLAEDPMGAHDRLDRAMTGDAHDLVLIDCPPSVGLLTINGLFAADRVMIVTEPSAWAVDGVNAILATIERVRSRRRGRPRLMGIAVNRLGRTRDMKFWHAELAQTHKAKMLPPIRQRAAIPEAAAQGLPVDALGRRKGATDAAEDFGAVLQVVLPKRLREGPGA